MRNWSRAALSQMRQMQHTPNDDWTTEEDSTPQFDPGSGEPLTREELDFRRRIESRLKKYYQARKEKLEEELQDRLLCLGPDVAVREFIRTTPRRGLIKSFVCSFLQYFVSPTDALGMLGFGRMHVLSLEHTQRLLEFATGELPENHTSSNPPSSSKAPGSIAKSSNASIANPSTELRPRSGALLDVGAGHGTVTDSLAPLFARVVTTETSSAMARSLRAKGYQCVETDDPSTSLEIMKDPSLQISAVACLNVLDRCSKPISLLRSLRRILCATGRGFLILAVVFPFSPYVESGTQTLDPEEPIDLGLDHLRRPSWETSVNAFHKKVLRPLGFEVRAVAKMPYVSEGDYTEDFYVLTDAVFVLSADDGDEPSLTDDMPPLIPDPNEPPSFG